jgi:hypothetical protein
VLKAFVQPTKIATAIVLTSLLVVVPWTRSHSNLNDFQTGLWAAVVVALVRQDNTSSSFLTGYQRLEGTVIGAIFSFFIFRLLGNAIEVTYPSIVIWLSICAFFRNGARHGYAAVVAAFTPMVLLLAQQSPSLDRAYDRIEKTFIGVAIYLAIDNLVLPVALKDGIRAATLNALATARTFTDQSIQGVNALMKEIHERQRAQSLTSTSSVSSSASLFTSAPAPALSDADFVKSRQSINNARASLAVFQVAVATAEGLLKLAVHEPAIFTRPFPLSEYTVLFRGFVDFSDKGACLLLAIEGFHRALDMIKEQTEAVFAQIINLSFMARKLCELQSSVDVALQKAFSALRLLFETGEVGVGFFDICSLSRTLEQLLTKVDEHFRQQYRDEATTFVNLSLLPLLAWQNVFESSCDLVGSIATLGDAISLISDAEGR